ncbi:MAG: hypothetical protein ACREMN_01380 [Gemmatimonadales bacterium]
MLRLLHIGFGALWVGMMFFTVVFLTPAVMESGPVGGKLMAALQRRRIMVIMPIFALITLVSGMMMFNRLAGGQHSALMATPMGQALAVGAASSILAFLLGIIVMRPAMVKAAKLGESVTSLMGKIVAALLLVALGAMAVARYV